MQNPDLAQLLQLAKSPAGQQLMQLLQRSGGDQARMAAEQAAAGNYAQARASLSFLLENPEVQKLLQQMGGTP